MKLVELKLFKGSDCLVLPENGPKAAVPKGHAMLCSTFRKKLLNTSGRADRAYQVFLNNRHVCRGPQMF